MVMKFYMGKKILKIKFNFKKKQQPLVSEQLKTILIILISVSIFGLLLFVFVKNYIKNKIQYYLEEKNKKTKED